MKLPLVLAGVVAIVASPVMNAQAQDALGPAVSIEEYAVVPTPLEPVPMAEPASPSAVDQFFAPYTTPFDAEEAPCSSCGGRGGASGFYNRCGCNTALFPWIRGPGRCDQWCVGPHWHVELDGLVFQRDANNWAPFTALVGTAAEFTDTFDVAPGARLFATGYNDSGYGLQIGYEGVNNFNAYANYLVGADVRAFDYESNYNSLEINFIPATDTVWRLFAGVRYIEIDENIHDRFTVAKVIADPVSGGTTSGPFTDTVNSRLLDNRLIGLQLGTFRDAWAVGRRLSVEAFANGGVYYNGQSVSRVARTDTVVYTIDDIDTVENEFAATTTTVSTVVKRNFTDTAFAGEAGVTGVFRLNPCFALRAGYQVLAVNRVGLASDAFFAAGPGAETIVYHGLQFGAEYRR